VWLEFVDGVRPELPIRTAPLDPWVFANRF
jgi:hypothetical protein